MASLAVSFHFYLREQNKDGMEPHPLLQTKKMSLSLHRNLLPTWITDIYMFAYKLDGSLYTSS
jgi:hypothetical protein